MKKLKVSIESMSVFDHDTGDLLSKHDFDPPIQNAYVENDDGTVGFVPIEAYLDDVQIGVYSL